MARPTPVFYIFHGEDEFGIAETLADFKRRLGPPEIVDLNTTVLEGKGLTLAEVRQACDSVPFLSDKRLVIIHGMLTQPREKSGASPAMVNALSDYLAHLPDSARLVLVENTALPAAHPVIQLAKQSGRGFVKQFDVPKAESLPSWITQRARKHSSEIEPGAARHLADLISGDLRLLDQEIVKLAIYTNGERPISIADVDALVPYAQTAIIFDLVDALGRRDGKTAARALRSLLGGSESPLGILGMIVRQFRLLLQLKDMTESGITWQDAAGELGVKPFPAKKLRDQSTYFTCAQLETVYRFLLDTDVAIKTGKLEPEVALDLLVAGLAPPEP